MADLNAVPAMIHMDGQCRTCGERWSGTFSKEGIKRKIKAHETGIRPERDRPIMLDCGHPLGWTEKERARLAAIAAWAIMLAPAKSAPVGKWKGYIEFLESRDVPRFIVDRVKAPHEEWRRKRNERRRRARAARQA